MVLVDGLIPLNHIHQNEYKGRTPIEDEYLHCLSWGDFVSAALLLTRPQDLDRPEVVKFPPVIMRPLDFANIESPPVAVKLPPLISLSAR